MIHQAVIDAMIAAGATGAVIAAAIQADHAMRSQSPGAIRTRRWREKKASQSVTERHGDVTVTSLPAPSRVPPITPLDTSLPKPNGFGREDAPSEELFLDLEKQLFDRGKQVLGKEAGGLIAKLLKAKQRNFALARAAIEMASTKQNAREYVAAVIRGPLPEENGWVWKRGIEGVI